jgi:protein tyrosine/serine phosphatase
VTRAELGKRRLVWEGCYNVRELGGLPIGDGKTTATKAFVRADDVSKLSPPGWESLAAHGVRTIVDLRHPGELRESGAAARIRHHAKTHGIRYENAPFLDEKDRRAMVVLERAATTRALYAAMLERFAANVGRIFGALADADRGTTLVQCLAGRDRTGLICGLLLDVSGVSRQTSADDYALSAECLQPLYDRVLATVDDDELRARLSGENRTPAENLLSALATLDDRFGGSEAYLAQCGVEAGTLDRVRDRLLGG